MEKVYTETRDSAVSTIEDIDLELADEQIEGLLHPAPAAGAPRAINIGPFSFTVIVDREHKSVEVLAKFTGIPIWDVKLVDGDDWKSVSRNLGLSKVSLAMKLDWDDSKVEVRATACVRAIQGFPPKPVWKCSDYTGNVPF